VSAGIISHRFPCASIFRTPRLNLAEIVEALAKSGALAVPLLGDEWRLSLLDAARASRFRAARPLVGKGERLVRQRMEVCEHFPADSGFRTLAREFQALWDDLLEHVSANPFTGRLVFNDLMLQRYSIGEVGITPHRDRTNYRNLVCLFVLEGKGRFYLCDDRAGSGAREIPHVAGDVVLMRAPGFQASAERPFHFVRDIQSPRTVFGLRQERAGDHPRGANGLAPGHGLG
jgi:hypothetical protein